MSITVKPQQKFGGGGESTRNDLDNIITGGGSGDKIIRIDIYKIETRCGDIVDFLKFTYNMVPIKGLSYNYPGNIYGGTGGTKRVYEFAYGEQMIGIAVDMVCLTILKL